MALVKKRFGASVGFYNRPFGERVVVLALKVPRGKVVTYGDLAAAAGGGAMSAQSITSLLGKAFDAGETRIPFHRIVYADGRVWIDETHKDERLARYAAEKISLDARNRIIDFASKRYDLHRALAKLMQNK